MTFSQQTSISDLPLGMGVQVLASNRHGLVALEKPAGVLSHPNRKGSHERCLLVANYDYDKEVYVWKADGVFHRAWLLNRLDSPTSGVLMLALDETIVPIMRDLFAKHKVRKTYYALVKHTPPSTAGCWKDVLKQDAYQNARVSKSETKRFAQTYYQLVSRSEGDIPVSLIKLMPVTGRTHQLRIQCNYHRHPIVGDRTHGDFAFNRRVFTATGEKRMMLHSAEIVFSYLLHGKKHDFHAESFLPETFTKLANPKSGQKEQSDYRSRTKKI
jgi:23S rRNA-/tRNA-specific pseudouridylate synthase